MFAAIVHAELHLPHALSLKDKRAILNRLKDRLRATGAAVSEVDHADLWQRAALGMAAVSGSATRLEESLAALRNIVDRQDEIVLLDWRVDHHE
jgi:uncharacterized protein YlxP (DUF503 family)